MTYHTASTTMHPDCILPGDAVKASPVGAGTVTGITDAGYPQVNHIAVGWLERTDGAVFDPHWKHGGTRGPSNLNSTDGVPPNDQTQQEKRNG